MNDLAINIVPRWNVQLGRPAPPPIPDANPIADAMQDYGALRENYSNVCAQLKEAHTLMQEMVSQHQAMEGTLAQERTFYRDEIGRLRRERDMLAAYCARMDARMDTIVETITAARAEATTAGAQVRQAVNPEGLRVVPASQPAAVAGTPLPVNTMSKASEQ
jgi:hypothetical protein